MEQTMIKQFPLEDLKDSCEQLVDAINTSFNADIEVYEAVKSLYIELGDFLKARQEGS